MVAVDRAATTSAAAVPVHRPAIAACRAREPARLEPPARRAAASPATTGEQTANTAPTVIATSYRCAGHQPLKRSGHPSGPSMYTPSPTAAPMPVPIAVLAGTAGDRRAVEARITVACPAITTRKMISPVQAGTRGARLLGGASATRSTAALTRTKTSIPV